MREEEETKGATKEQQERNSISRKEAISQQATDRLAKLLGRHVNYVDDDWQQEGGGRKVPNEDTTNGYHEARGKESRSKTRTTEERDMIDKLVRGSFKAMKDIAKQTQEELINLRMKEGGNLTEHFNTFNLCITGLQKVNVVDSTEDVVMMLWAPLPSSYEHFWKMLMIGKSILDFEEVVEDLDCSSKCKGKKGNERNPKFKDNKRCFKYGSTEH
ncbi:unnamed protein product [Prunus armeniaca]